MNILSVSAGINHRVSSCCSLCYIVADVGMHAWMRMRMRMRMVMWGKWHSVREWGWVQTLWCCCLSQYVWENDMIIWILASHCNQSVSFFFFLLIHTFPLVEPFNVHWICIHQFALECSAFSKECLAVALHGYFGGQVLEGGRGHVELPAALLSGHYCHMHL